MADGYKDDELMVRYVLGLATEKERKSVETRFFADDDYFDQMVALEEEIVDQYVTGRMPPEHEEAFEKSLSPQRSEDVRFASALLEAITKKKQRRLNLPERSPVIRQPEPRRWSNTFKIAASFALVFTATIVLLIVWWQDRASILENQVALLGAQNRVTQQDLIELHNEKQIVEQELERERTARMSMQIEVDRIHPGSARHPRDFAPFELTATSATRGSGDSFVNELKLPKNVRFALFQIRIGEYPRHESHRISVKQPGEAAFLSLKGLTASSGDANLLTFTVPVNRLGPGHYVLILEGERSGEPAGELEQYSFRVTADNAATQAEKGQRR